MQYLLYPLLLIIYFEVIGRWILYKFDKDVHPFSFVVGFIGLMGIMFITLWPITVFNQSFYMLLCAFIFINLLLAVQIIKDLKNINFKLDIKLWILLFVLVVFQCIISANRSLGEVHGFDTLYYLNMVDFNIGNTELNSLHPHFGTYPNLDIQWHTYIYQSFYYFIAIIIYIFRYLLSFIGMSFDTLPAFIWGMQILLNFIIVGTGLICVDKLKIKNKVLNISFTILIILFIGNLYYNNSFGFIGNNYRMSIHAISTIFLIDYLKEYKIKDFWLFILMQFGLCAVASTGTFALIFILFGMFFVLYNKEKNLLKYYALIVYLPITTILVTKFYVKPWIFVVTFILCAVVYFLNDYILKLYHNKYLRIGTIIAILLILMVGSTILSGDIISIEMFFNNYSEYADMSWDYFDFFDLRHYIFNLIVLIPLMFYLYKERKNNLAIIFIILIVTFFNPLASYFMNTLNWVYYRAYDIIINQFTICLFVYFMYQNIAKITYKKVFTIIVFVASCFMALTQIPLYFHESFKVSDSMDMIHKIDKEELEVIRNVKEMIKDYDIKEPKIITSTFYMASYIDNSIYLFGKEKRFNSFYQDESANELYKIFFPVDHIYDNFRPSEKPDYQNCLKYLNNTNYNILVVDNGLYYKDEIKNEHLPLTNLIESDKTYVKSEYSTSKYAVYLLNK